MAVLNYYVYEFLGDTESGNAFYIKFGKKFKFAIPYSAVWERDYNVITDNRNKEMIVFRMLQWAHRKYTVGKLDSNKGKKG